MQIDYHHAVTYVVARCSGFDHADARTVAHAAQYVDDATNDGLIHFTNKAMYQRIASAHKMLDYRNMENLANHRVWIPFHFLPGNDDKRAGENPDTDFREKIVCRPNSHVAQDMVRACIRDRHKPNALHRLGITMHVYADTWAHRGFAGINDTINLVRGVKDRNCNPDPGFLDRAKNYFADLFDARTSEFIGGVLPLGHGAALSYPDRPFLKWHYTNGKGEFVERDNPKDFIEAANHLCIAMRRFQAGDPDADVPGLSVADGQQIDAMLRTTVDDDGDARHKVWIEAIAAGAFRFGRQELRYTAKGEGSWKHQAIGDTNDTQETGRKFQYRPEFLGSDWKLFHDALMAHRFVVIHEILPRYGICVA